MKTRILSIIIFMSFSFTISAQLKVRSNGSIHVGYNGYANLYLGSDTATYNGTVYDNGKWGIEVYNGGLNFWKPWPTTNSSNFYLYLSQNGNIGIGKESPSFKLDVDGDIATYGTLRISSDARLKTNINPLSNCLEKLNLLNGKSYNKACPTQIVKLENMNDTIKYKTGLIESQRKINRDNSIQFGLLAGEVKNIFPELVKSDSAGYLTVDYIGLIPVIVEALKEQKIIIEQQSTQIKIMQNLVNNKISTKGSQAITNEEKNMVKELPASTLAQNIPNPFTQNTEINYYLSEVVEKAMLCIYDMTGKQLKNISINHTGEGKITIDKANLRPGIYLYSLIADGQEIDTKRMILAE